MQSKKTGLLGENIAVKYLEQKGYRVLDRNYINRYSSGPQKGEIDIVAKKEDVLVFVEVKAVSGNSLDFFPEDKVNFQKQQKIIKAGQIWLMKNKIPIDSRWQVDVLGINIDSQTRKATVRHYENV